MSFAAPRLTRPRSAGSLRTSSSRNKLTMSTRPRPKSAGLRRSKSELQMDTNRTMGGCSSSLSVRKKRTLPKPPKAHPFRKRLTIPHQFRRHYDRGDLPVRVMHGAKRKLEFREDIQKLDYHHYLPLFFDGLRDKREPYKFIAEQGVYKLIEEAEGRIVPCVPQIVIPIKEALNTRDPEVLCRVLRILQRLAKCDLVGEALVPYYRQLLPVLNLFSNVRRGTGDEIDYGQRKNNDLGELIQNTLEIFEQYGGPDAFINIKYMVPTYESCQ